jgi:outer membrane protein assembly factor BamA
MFVLRILLIVLGFGIGLQIYGQSVEDGVPKKKSNVVLPLIFFTPETDWGFGAAGISTFRFKDSNESDRPSQIQLGGAYTLKKQVLSYLSFQLFTPNQSYFLFGEVGYYRYTYPYYGIGNNTNVEDEEFYSVNFPRIRLNALKRVGKNWYVGLRYWWDDYQLAERQIGGLLFRDEVVGSESSVISTLGTVAIFDNRDHLFYPSKGWYLEASLSFSGSVTAASHHYRRLTIDVSKYILLGKENHILALNAFTDLNFGDVPFQQLAFIGGTKKMRGFIEGRHRDEKLLMFQAEYRFPLFWILKGAAFGGTGQVAPDFNDFSFNELHVSYGLGLRVQINKEDKVHVRIDFGFNEEGEFLPYLTFNEAF